MKRLHKVLLLFALFSIISCTTQKKKDDVSKLGKFYHNTTAEFNGYFNANVLYTESIAKLNEQHQDNYNQVLDVYEYVAADNPQAVAGDLDEAIKKVSIVIALHRVSHWTDDSYLLMGKCQYAKQDYESAEETLEYLVDEYSPEALTGKKSKAKKKVSAKKKKSSAKKRKKESEKRKKAQKKKRKKANKEAKKRKKKGKSSKKKKSSSAKKSAEDKKASQKDNSKITTEAPKKTKKDKKEEEAKPDENDNYFLKHRPCHQETMLWLARTYIERENYDQASAILSTLQSDPKTFEDIKMQVAPAQAHFFLKQKQYESAIAPLERAIQLADKKEDKARYTFILAQIHQQANRSEAAVANFEKVIKLSKSYEMEFSARLSLAKNGWLTEKATAEEATKTLKKMLKDIKNEEYKDQIYYALADIALKNNNKNDAITYLKQSLIYSTANSSQKTESYLLLANLYYEGEDFVNAKLYYDSTLQVLAESDQRYTGVNRLSNNLTEIAENIQIIQVQDSLLRIGSLSQDEKLAIAYKIKKDRDEARLQALKDKANQQPDKFKRGVRTASRSGAKSPDPSKFFAYNEKALKKGKKDFEKRWGADRKLDDNWRRSGRRGAGGIDEIAAEIEVASNALTEDDVAKILKDIPGSPDEIQAAENKIIDALFTLGSLYRDRLKMDQKSIKTLEELNTRFPGNKHELDSWYFLYLAHTDLNNKAKAKEYFDKIISKYPDSTYAGVLKDPNYLENSKEAEKRLTLYYNETYNAFSQGQYQSASQRAVKATELFGASNTFQPRFALLYAMCVGNLQGKDAYRKELEELIAKYPSTPEQTRAREILRFLGGSSVTEEQTEQIGGEKLKVEESVFKVEDDKLHYFIIALKNNTIKLSEAKNAVTDYNQQYHKLDKLRISNVYLGADTSTPILVIRRYKTKELAMKYFDSISKNSKDFLPAGTDYEMFAVTQYNYRQILKNKTLDGYREFFEENYK